MRVDQATLDQFIGGELEIQNPSEKYIYRGEISYVILNGEELYFGLAWMAKGVGYPPIPYRWERDDRRTYGINLMLYMVSDIGDGRLCLDSPYTGELTVLFPPNGSKLDQSRITEKNGSPAT